MNPLVVVGAGAPGREGGVDLFLELMAAVAARRPARFAWVGGRPRGVARRLDAETATLGLDGCVEWLPRGASPREPGVVHVVTARTLAAAQRSLAEVAGDVPVLGIAADPAVRELLEDRGSQVVPYPDLAGLAQLVVAGAGPGGADGRDER